jgi:peptidoglycan/xylan/chitin deacetylase (PgdA/CDA1 family)
MARWFKWAMGLTLALSLLTAPFSNSLPTNAQTKSIDPIFEISIAQLHLRLMPQEEPEVETEDLPPQQRVEQVNCKVEKCIALTFDDGPSEHTLGILKSLHKQGARATFFAIGLQLRLHPEIAREVVLQGHELGGHSYSHRKLQFLSKEELVNDFNYVAKLMELATDTRPGIFRPPYGQYDDDVLEVAKLPMVLWSVDPKDWLTKDPDETYQRVIKAAHPGAIVVMHDNLGSTRHALPRILKTLKNQGFKFVTVSELLGPMSSGEIYKAGPDGKQ